MGTSGIHSPEHFSRGAQRELWMESSNGFNSGFQTHLAVVCKAAWVVTILLMRLLPHIQRYYLALEWALVRCWSDAYCAPTAYFLTG